ncbi:MAG: carbohydrate binding family 9 domain-containing protein [Gemmatimonadota bacterium]|nr:carbohydrate binding family 9 domain-containing protein [Gemmatimonadota bacterium]
MKIMRFFGTVFAVAVILGWPGGLDAQGNTATPGDSEPPPERVDPESVPRPTLRAHRIDSRIRIDGNLDEAVWFEADSAYEFVQALPRDGMPMSDRTVVRILYDEDNIYVGAVMYEEDTDGLRVPGLEQDYETHDSDMFGVAFDTYFDRSNAFMFGVNPAGGLFDAQNFNDSRYTNRAWEGVVHVKTRVLEDRWLVEMAIPFRTLRFTASDDVQSWGMNLLRRIRRRGEDGYWAPLPRMYRLHKMSRAGTLEGLQGLRQGRNLQIKPYVSGSNFSGAERLASETGFNGDVGFDLKYGITPQMTLDATALTDFSQVEVDQEQVNLTRFSLFFPEKRDFFMENAGAFAVGDVTERNFRMGSSTRDFTLFHSRRIGLVNRKPVPILGGARLTGRAGDFEIGLLEMQTGELGIRDSVGYVPAENFGVFRLRKNVGTSDFGFLFTNRQNTTSGLTDNFNRTFAFDANLQPHPRMILTGYVARSLDDANTGNENYNAARLAAGFRDQFWDVSASFKHVGDGFDPGMGFVQRNAMREAYATVGIHPEPDISAVQEMNPYIETRFVAGLDGVLETREVNAGFGATFVDGTTVNLTYNNNFERLRTLTNIVGEPVAAGDYPFSDVALMFRPSGANALSGTFRASHGNFYDGSRTSIGGNALFRPNYHLQLDATVQYNDLEIGGVRKRVNVYGGRIRYAYNTNVFASTFVQYNDETEELVTNVRLNLIHAPLSDIFFVYTERRYVGADVAVAQLRDRVFTVKVTQLLGF